MADDRKGHRERMVQKFDTKGAVSLTDHELFEILLFPLLPRIDTKPIVKKCFREFKTFSGIINATSEQLEAIDGIGPQTARHINIIATLLEKISFERTHRQSFITNWTELQSYCIQKLSHHPIETLHAILLNNQNQIISVEYLGSGTVNQMTVYPREILKVALSKEAVGLILVHNHPSGDAKASRADIDLTNKLQITLKSANITLYDHLIVAHGRCVSLRNQGLYEV